MSLYSIRATHRIFLIRPILDFQSKCFLRKVFAFRPKCC